MNGVRDYAAFAAEFSGDARCSSFVGAKIDLPLFCRIMEHRYGDASAILENMTVLGAQVRLGEGALADFAAIITGASKPMLSELVFLGPTQLKYCTLCLQEDMETYGMSSWRRIHQIPVLGVCPDHRVALIRYDVRRTTLHTSFPLPGDLQSGCGGCATGYGASVFCLEVADVIRGCLCNAANSRSAIIKAAISDGLRTRGFADRHGNLRRSKIVDKFAVALTEIAGPMTFANPTEVAKSLIKTLDTSLGLPFGSALWIAWLFGSWGAFIERCRWTETFGVPDESIREMNAQTGTAPDLTRHYKQICLNHIRANSGCSRQDFTRAEYRAFRWLLHNDAAWLCEVLPFPHRGAGQLPLFPSES